MTFRPLLVGALLALLLLPATARAQDGEGEQPAEESREKWEQLTEEERAEKLRLYEERWKNLPEEERRRRMELFEERLRGLSPGEMEELKRKLRQVKERADLEELRHKQGEARRLEDRIYHELAPRLREKVDALPEGLRERLLRHGVWRSFAIAQERFEQNLTEEERKRLEGLEGGEKMRAVGEIARRRVLEGLSEEERARLEAMPPPERRTATEKLMHRAMEEQFLHVRRAVAKELEALLQLSPEELDRRLSGPSRKGRFRPPTRRPGFPR